MNNSYFNKFLQRRLDEIRRILGIKGAEYARDADRLSAFKDAASFQGCTPEQALWGMASKHIIALNDFIKHPGGTSYLQWEEKAGDTINYLILLLGVIREKFDQLPDGTYCLPNALPRGASAPEDRTHKHSQSAKDLANQTPYAEECDPSVSPAQELYEKSIQKSREDLLQTLEGTFIGGPQRSEPPSDIRTPWSGMGCNCSYCQRVRKGRK